MKIGSNSQNLLSLASLLDATKQQQQSQRDNQEKLQDSRENRLQAREQERSELISQNRDALKKIQNDIRVKNLRRLQETENFEEKSQGDVNLNLRENISAAPSAPEQPAFKKLGQIVDLKI